MITATKTYVGHTKGDWRNLLFILPYLIIFMGLIVIPLVWGISLSFEKVDLFGSGKFVGLQNYERLFGNKIFLQTVWNTLYFVVLTVPALVVLGLFLAIVLNKQTKTAAILRGIFFSSTILSVTVVTLIWRIVFIPNDGLMYNIFLKLGLEPIAFLSDKDWALVSVAVATVWWCLGLPMMLFIAALQQIPKDIYEAAELDNASRITVFFRITVPSIMRTIILVTIIEIVMQFQLFGQALLMTNGGPNNMSRSMVMFIYDTGFRRWDIGMAAAASQVLFAIILIAAMAQYFVSSRKRNS